ncbi:hypothetical protein KEM56_007352 [Ascosphaera pollenicola]|nr:hypothetical protein KEM56_007352 [Ascosphaera pollenicola]
MFARITARASPARSLVAARRGFASTRTQLSGHYPEGPRSNIPFNPLQRGFFWKYWGVCGIGFGAPFAIAVWQTKKNK